MASVLIAEPGYSGHVLVFVSRLAAASRSRGYRTRVLVTREAATAAEARLHLNQEDLTDVAPGPLSLDDVVRTSRGAEADIVLIPNGDLLVGAVARHGWRGRGHLRLVIMRDPRWESGGPLKARLRRRAKMLVIRVAARRGASIYWLREPGYAGPEPHVNDPVIVAGDISDVIEAGRTLRAQLDLDPQTFWFGMTGVISAHKNLPLVLDALRVLRRLAPDASFGFALLGPRSSTLAWGEDRIRAELEALPCGYCRRVAVLSNEEMNAVVAALDCVVMAYSTSAPNSTLAKAAAFGTPIAAGGNASIARFVSALDCGPTVPLTVDDLAQLLLRRLGAARGEPRPELLRDDFTGPLLRDVGDPT